MVRWALFAVAALTVAACGGSRPAHRPAKRTEVVLIYAREAGPNSGTGWVYDDRRGLVATAFHVVDGASTVLVQAGPDGWRWATVVAAAPCEDVALLDVGDTRGLTALALGDARTLSPGTTVAALGFGNAHGTVERGTYFGTVRTPRVALGPRLRGTGLPPFDDLLETSQISRPGFSGGPVVGRDGRLVGMTIGVHTSPDGTETTFANRVDRVRRTLARLDRGTAPGRVGTGLYFRPAGVVVTGLVPGGYVHGGVLVKAIDGAPVGRSFTSWCRSAGRLPPGAAELAIVRRPGARPERIAAVINRAPRVIRPLRSPGPGAPAPAPSGSS
jgi:S1-C subfamily serine protease